MSTVCASSFQSEVTPTPTTGPRSGAQDVLTGGDDLAGFGVDRSNDPVDLRMKLRVAEIFPRERQFRLGRVALCLGRLQVADCGLTALLGAKAVF